MTIPILASVSILHWVAWYTSNTNDKNSPEKQTKTEQIDGINQSKLSEKNISLSGVDDSIKSQIFVCLEADEDGSFMYTKALESIDDPENTILELPISHLFQTYWDNPHPLYVPWVSKNFRALVWRNWLETNIPQAFSSHKWKVTSETAYLIDDTLRFSLINPKIKDDFSEDLWDQLQEPWFEWFSDSENFNYSNDNVEPYYDIVVKKVPSWKSALALYKNWKLFMATYVSIWLDSNQTRMWQFQIEWSDPYKRSIKYDDAPMPFALKYSWWYFFHQWNVTWYPASHWCIRLSWAPASVLYSLVKDKPHTDVFINKDLYKIEK